jgi:hypothetical protein
MLHILYFKYELISQSISIQIKNATVTYFMYNMDLKMT